MVAEKVKKLQGFKRAQLFQTIFVWSMIIIPIVHWLIFWLGVNLNSILMAFQLPTGEYSLFTLQQVIESLGNAGSKLTIAVKNTLTYFVVGLFMTAFNLVVSYCLFKKVRAWRFFEIAFYLPSIVGGVVMELAFVQFLSPVSAYTTAGPIVELLMAVGVPAKEVPVFLGQDWANKTLIFYTCWIGWGGNMLLFCGAFARIPLEVIESARLDGISGLKELIYILFPLIWPTFSTILVLQFTGLFGAGGPVLTMTGGNFDTQTIGYWIYDLVTESGSYNEVAAAGLVFTCIGTPIALFVRWLVDKVPAVEY